MIRISQLGRVLGLTLGAAGLAGVGALAALRRPLPRTVGKQSLHGLNARVQVLRDRWGVPHIYAANSTDLFMAQGYVHAQDRLWQMELNRRLGHGQLAELFGPVALSSDRFIRVLGFGRLARHELELLDEPTRAVIDAYVAGVNGFLSHARGRLPIEFTLLRHQPRPWQPVDVLVWGKMMALNLSENWTGELLRAQIVAALGADRAAQLEPRDRADHPLTVPAGAQYQPGIGTDALRLAAQAAPFTGSSGRGQGSNGWVVSGSRSASGKPLLADDPHLGLGLPSIWYEMHLEGGEYAVTGASLPGVPSIVIGHNARIAWGVTNVMADVQDLYIERFDPGDPLRYEWQGGWQQAELVREEIIVKGQPDPVVEEVRITRHGPIVSPVVAQQGGHGRHGAAGETAPLSALGHEAVALRWTALEPGRINRAGLALNRARDWDDFRAALADWNVPPQNFVYADVDGHFGYAVGGDLPIRAPGHDGRLPVPGWDGAHEWQGYIPAAELPATLDPDEGFVVTANNRLVGNDYPYQIGGEWLNGYRAARIRELLAVTPRHDASSFARIQHDRLSLPGLELVALADRLPADTHLATAARDALIAWDGDIRPESVAATIYDALRYQLVRLAYREIAPQRLLPIGLGTFASLPANLLFDRAVPGVLEMAAAREDEWLGSGRTWDAVLAESWALALADLRARLGDDLARWRYGRIHSLTLRHPLGASPALARIFNRGPWATGGDTDTVCQEHQPHDTASGPAYIGPSYRQICDTADWDRSRSILATGQSGHPGSRHYADMAGPWRSGGYHPMLWSRRRVEEETVARLSLEPE